MALLPSDEVGRGNQDEPNRIRIEAVGTSFNVGVGTIAFTAVGDVRRITIPQPNGAASITIDIGQNIAPTTGTINIASGARNGEPAAQNIENIINTDQGIPLTATSSGTASAAILTIKNDNGGITGTPSEANQVGTVTGFTTGTIKPGANGVEVDEVEYIFNGPFANVIPVKSPLQGLARVAFNINQDLIRTLDSQPTSDDATILSALELAVTRYTDAARAANPQNIPEDGIFRSSSENGKIAIKGTRRDSDGEVGRGRHGRDFTYTNETADRSVRQIILRRIDSFFDLISIIIDPAENAAAITSFIEGINREIQLDAPELERALGELGIGYENTIVDRSSDQGMLVFSDIIRDATESLRAFLDTSPTTLDELETFVNGTTGFALDKLKLKN